MAGCHIRSLRVYRFDLPKAEKMKKSGVDNPSDKGPRFRVSAGSVELGAAWQKTSEKGRDYLSVKLDDPSFPAPIYATLAEVEGEDGLQFIWSRPNRD